jgi:hypothetical protein
MKIMAFMLKHHTNYFHELIKKNNRKDKTVFFNGRQYCIDWWKCMLDT